MYLFSTIKKIHSILKPFQRQKLHFSVLLLLVNAVFELISLAAILPIILLALDTNIIHENNFVNDVYMYLGFNSEVAFLLTGCMVLIGLFIFKNLIGWFINYYQNRFTYNVAADLSRQNFSFYFKNNYLDIVRENSSVWARNILHLPIEFSNYILLSVINFLSDFIIFAAIVFFVLWYNAIVLIMLSLFAGLPLYFILRSQKKKLSKVGNISRDLVPLSLKEMYHGIDGFVEINLYAKEQFFIKKFINIQKQLNRNYALFHSLGQLPQRLIEVVTVLGIALLFVYGLLFSESKQEMILLLSLFAAAAYRVMPSLNRMSISLMNIKTYGFTINALYKIQSPHKKKNFSDKNIIFNKSIEFKNVSFSYGDKSSFALHGINFIINRGDTAGFIGKSGAGKTTLLNILLRFIKEDSGNILVDDYPLDEEHVKSWQKKIGYVQQNTFILDGTISENITFGEKRENRKIEKLTKAVEQAGLKNFVESLPDNLEAIIGEKGARISGGQKQRIAIARALYRDAEIFIFDEATSELDKETKSDILKSIEKLSEQDFTIIIISHQEDMLKNCTKIYEIKNRKIIEKQTQPVLE